MSLVQIRERRQDVVLVIVYFLHPKATEDHVGMIPDFLDESDPRPAKEQIHDNYVHGGGWRNMKGFTLNWLDETPVLQYPGDPKLRPLAVMRLREERIFVYQYGITAIIQPDGSFEAARLD